jgi:hypothetical protein
MKKTITCLAGVALALALPSSAAAKHPGGAYFTYSAAKACKAERADLGTEAFRGTYAQEGQTARRAFRNCVRAQRAARRTAFREARQSCRDERSADRVAFYKAYGKRDKARAARHGKRAFRTWAKRRAFVRCVAQKYKENLNAGEQAPPGSGE